ncbi:YqjF family protein [Paenisporosarcina sp.]|uniref:YqjF family protein n=1 Tax=Paenisporosarcina sp. TaxID=1932001 RepID=UPI003C77ABA2
MLKRPWLMTQEWHDVLFLHWPISPDVIRKHIPIELELDLYNNIAWVGFVFFKVKGNRPRLIPPVPGMRSFLELNFRTYVTYKGRKGIHAFSLNASNSLIVKLTTLGHFLPYRYSKVRLKRHKKMFTYSLTRKNLSETIETTFQVVSKAIESNHFEQWLTERYHLWTKPKHQLYRIDTSHSPWMLQYVTGIIHGHTMASFLQTNSQTVSPVAHYSKMKKARFFAPVKEY